MFTRRQYLYLTLIALLAILFSTLAPSASNWLAQRAGAPAAEICTIAGIRKIAPGAAPVSPVGWHQGMHCPFCLLHDPQPLIPARQFALPLLKREHGAALAVRRDRRIILSGHWPPAQPRAPPRLS